MVALHIRQELTKLGYTVAGTATAGEQALKMIEDGGFDHLHMAFFNGKDPEGHSYDIGDDGVWDVWQLEGPNMVWYFRGEPHVHTWVHVREPAKA